MRLIKPFFQKLKPSIEYLCNEVIIAQAWKKTHAYMRTHNWYADTLALDVSALGLEANAVNWAKQLGDSSITLFPLELIPAAKSEEWTIDREDGWIPKSSEKQSCEQLSHCLNADVINCPNAPVDQYCKKNKEQAEHRKNNPPLRPLAHLMVRDQTWATAAMICLADIVETVQGDCNENNFQIARSKKVYSYGNRLLCDWRDGKAWFRWGNSQTYRKFFTDYQNFLKRPVAIGSEIAASLGETDRVYIISLDLKKFYDHVDKKELSIRLQDLCTQNGYDICEYFWNTFDRITDWQWSAKAHVRANDLNLTLGKGLPQGLVSSGFFANAYMLNFDQKVGTYIHKSIPDSNGIVLHDYCRYVDDLRLVVSIDDDDLYDQIANTVNHWISKLLTKHAGEHLRLNTKKTSITALADLNNSGSISGRINQLQHDLSGPVDRDIIESSMGVLEGLLSTPTEDLLNVSPEQDKDLIRIVKFDNDVRPDTLKRFAANRLETIVRNKRKMTESLTPANDREASSIDNESELIAKKLVWAWMKDPSLALVLRKAIEIFPSPSILEPALSAIYRRCSFVENSLADNISSAMADYLLADMFRCCSEFHSYFQRVDYPKAADPEAVLAVAYQFAQKAIAHGESLPVFVKRQALLLLAILQKPAPLEHEEAKKEDSMQDSLHRILIGKQPYWHHQRFALYEVAAQITNTPTIIASFLLEATEQQEISEQKKLIDELAKRGGPFWESFWKKMKKSKITKSLINDYKWAAPVLPSSPQKVPQRLAILLASNDNPFVHESALIKLALSLLKALQDTKLTVFASPSQIEVSQDGERQNWVGWAEIWRPGVSLISKESPKSYPYDKRFSLPSWINDDLDAINYYWLGSILRAVIVGAADFTGNRWKSAKNRGYRGLRTGWYKRRMGMMHAPEALVGDYATISQWTSELLMKCLQWPGFESTHISHMDIKKIETTYDLVNILEHRLFVIDNLYCRATDLPVLITRVKRPSMKKDKLFRLVTVQSLLPKSDSFSKDDPTLSNPNTKARNRDHLARVCQITYKTLLAKLKTEAEVTDEFCCSDLIVFPEISVHPDDQDILKRLADKTKSMVLAGLVFMDHAGKLVNIARWFLPDYRQTGRQWMIRDQGKKNLTPNEKSLGIKSYRPCQHIIEVEGDAEGPYKITCAICYDSTDLKLASDLKGKTDLFVIIAHNKDVNTFDAMATALHYHMYQHIALVNKGEYGGTTIQAPYKEQYDRLITHVHGLSQISINVSDLDLAAFNRINKNYKEVKTPPANTENKNKVH